MSLAAAVLIPFDPNNRSYMVVRSTNWHPVPRFRHKIKGIGGIVEDGEGPLLTVMREMDEEQPGWFLRIPGTSKRWGELGREVDAVEGLHRLPDVDGKDGWVWNVFAAPTDLGLHSFHKARKVATESTPEVWSLGTVPDEADCLPGFREALVAMHRAVATAYPSLGIVVPA